MVFVSLFKFREKPAKYGSEEFERTAGLLMRKLGVKVLLNYWTLWKYDAVTVY